MRNSRSVFYGFLVTNSICQGLLSHLVYYSICCHHTKCVIFYVITTNFLLFNHFFSDFFGIPTHNTRKIPILINIIVSLLIISY